MKDKTGYSLFFFTLLYFSIFAQGIQVHTLVDLNASGGVTLGPDGHIYISDFGPSLSQTSVNTTAYQMEYGTWKINSFASGFSGASGSRFDSKGNFYQSNPSGARVSKRDADGTLHLNWATGGFSVPIGIVNDADDNLFVCNCGNNTIRKITPDGSSTLFASSALFNCPNGLTIDPEGNLYVCNFNDGKVLKITPDASVTEFVELPTAANVGNGHLTYSNGSIFIATIGAGQIFKINMDGEELWIAGKYAGFSNEDGNGDNATFSKPNGLAASITGDTLFVNCSVPTWSSNAQALHPGVVRMITGICSLPDASCPLLSPNKNITNDNSMVLQQLSIAPNPVDQTSRINYQLSTPQKEITLKVYDQNQRLVKTLFSGGQQVGTQQLSFDVKGWSNGVYFLVLQGEKFRATQKLVVLR